MKRIVALIAGLVFALGVSTASAYFTEQVSIADNVITVGYVEMSVEPTASAMSADALAPGTSFTRVLSVSNDGDLPVGVVVTGAKKAGFTAVYDALECAVSHEGVEVYSGPLSTLRTDVVPIVAGTKGDFEFTVSLPSDAEDSLQGDYVKMTLYVDAEQVH